ncbi:FMN-binding protein [Humibacter ginsenosidimutans]|uniref:FMN-binding protein n=1 Tax=Humibacter ginsenosidimutans TaxID=2599293 RepID=A0A5B8M3M3_9MICO|nr:FMN-binding protein [Humibacter ginsenosidimutans]QDZ14322.1 FMN-binding protein [Humibacter ginsenosidimutans]
MKKIIYGLLATVTGVVLLFSYRTSLDAVSPTTATGGEATGTGSSGAGTSGSGAASSTGSSSSGSGSSSSSDGASSSTSSSSGLKDGTYTGASADTRYGPVQVEVTVSGGRITKVSVPVYPTESFRDEQINQRAVPQLVSETMNAQSSKIDMVSGATFTSEGYLQSLQSALDDAHA